MKALRYLIAVTIWQLLNPYGLWQSVRQASGQLLAALRFLTRKAPPPMIPFSLPFDGRWQVLNGGVTRTDSHSWYILAQRYAYDFAVAVEGERHAGAGHRATDYFAFGQNVLAAADGVVIAVRNDIQDYAGAGSGWIDTTTHDIRGNFVVIQHAERLYSLSAHLQAGSVLPKPGDAVRRGEFIGRCGNSGHSTEPHLHFQVQDHPDFFQAIGLPVAFTAVASQPVGDGAVERKSPGWVTADQSVWNLPAGADEMGERPPDIPIPGDAWLVLFISLGVLVGFLAGLYIVYSSIVRAALNVVLWALGRAG